MSAPEFAVSTIPAADVAAVPQRSPLRYPGGKTWLVPHVREWLKRGEPTAVLVEPFAGGGVVSLTAVMERLADRAIMVDLDRDVAAFWRAALRRPDELIAHVRSFRPERGAVEQLSKAQPIQDDLKHGFRTLVLNRTRRGGVLAPGAALIRNGENSNGLASRWYPDTLEKRIRDIAIEARADRLRFFEADGMRMMEDRAADTGTRFFVDPPYTGAGGKRAGFRLYAHNEVDHARIFRVLAESRADFLMTYDHSPEAVALVRKHGFHAVVVKMKNSHHARIPELIIARDRLFS